MTLSNAITSTTWCAYQCWSGVVSFANHSGICNEDITFFDTNRLWVVDDIFAFDIIQVYILCKNLHT